MAVYFVPKDKKRRTLVENFELKWLKLDFFLRNAFLPVYEKHQILMFLPKIIRKTAKFSTQPRNRCVLTGRSGSIFRYFRVSRILLKETASRGFLPGVQKSS